MKKDELLTVLKKLNTEEEQAIPFYTQHIENTFFFSDFPRETQKKLKETLLILAKESEGHARIFKEIIKNVQESDQDVY